MENKNCVQVSLIRSPMLNVRNAERRTGLSVPLPADKKRDGIKGEERRDDLGGKRIHFDTTLTSKIVVEEKKLSVFRIYTNARIS